MVHVRDADQDVLVRSNRTLLDALKDDGVDMMWDCLRGECGLCTATVIDVEGELDHRDVFLSEQEKEEGGAIVTCVSRAVGGRDHHRHWLQARPGNRPIDLVFSRTRATEKERQMATRDVRGGRVPESRSRSRPRRDARAGRRCTRTGRSSTSTARRLTRTASGSGTRCTSRCRCRPSTSSRRITRTAAFAGWQNRAFAVPPAMGVDYRIVNGYVYISPNPVTDPEEIGRAGGDLPEARGLLLRQLGRALRQVAGEDGGAQPRGRGDRGADPRPVRGRGGSLHRPQAQQRRAARRLPPRAPLRWS